MTVMSVSTHFFMQFVTVCCYFEIKSYHAESSNYKKKTNTIATKIKKIKIINFHQTLFFSSRRTPTRPTTSTATTRTRCRGTTATTSTGRAVPARWPRWPSTITAASGWRTTPASEVRRPRILRIATGFSFFAND